MNKKIFNMMNYHLRECKFSINVVMCVYKVIIVTSKKDDIIQCPKWHFLILKAASTISEEKFILNKHKLKKNVREKR